MNIRSRLPRGWATALCFLVPLALYGATAARSAQGGDANEFALIGMLGGVAHPPGYPLYTLLLRAMRFLPIAPPFLRMSLASALCAAGAVAVVQRVGARLTGTPAVLAALAFAIAPIQWRMAGIPEVFALHALLVALALLAFLRLVAPGARLPREAFVFGLTLGLGMANQYTMVLCAPLIAGAAVAVLRCAGARGLAWAVPVAFAGGVVGLTPYLLLVPWGHGDPLHAWIWGSTGTWEGFWRHLSRQEFGAFRLAPGRTVAWSDRLRLLRAFLVEWPRQYAWLFFGLGLWGSRLLWRRDRLVAGSIGGTFILAGFVFPPLMNLKGTPVHLEKAENFFLMPLVLFAPFVAAGVCDLLSRAEWRRWRPPAVCAAILILAAVVTAPTVDWPSDPLVQRYLVASVAPVARNAVILGSSDTLMSGYGWVRRVLHLRPDVHYVDVNLLHMPWYAERIHRELPGVMLPDPDDAFGSGDIAPVVAVARPTYVIPSLAQAAREHVTLEPDGLLFRVVPPGTPAISLDSQAERLARDLKALGQPVAPPIDAWSAALRWEIVFQLGDLMNRYSAAGRTAGATRVETSIQAILPLDGAEAEAP